MEETVPFGSTAYLVTLSLLVFARGMDLLSTRIATPNLVLEANPIARRLGWMWGGLFNLGFAGLLACWPVPALVVVTTSLMVAGRNFKSAWLMRSLGEAQYQALIVGVMAQTSLSLYLACLIGETSMVGIVGAAVMYLGRHQVALLAIGLGIVAYAAAVAFYTLLSLWRIRSKTG